MNIDTFKRSKQNSFGKNVSRFIFMLLFVLCTITAFPQVTITWSGTTDTAWGTPTNWIGNVLPTPSNNITIPNVTNKPIIGYIDNAECNNLTIDQYARLTIQSSSIYTGSLIVHGTFTGPGTVIAQRYMGTGWHHVSSPISGQTLSSFWNGYNVGLMSNQPNPDDSRRSMKIYDETTDNWGPLFTTSTEGNLDDCKGYSIWTNNGGTLSFTGTLRTGSASIGVTHNNFGWNCVGNPYSSAIAINLLAGNPSNFISYNSSKLEPSFNAVYLWNGTDGSYSIYNNSTSAKKWANIGQAFFVKVTTSATQIDFTPEMQQHQHDALLKSGEIPWPEIKLIATLENSGSSTIIRFNETMKRGLDIGYDAGTLKSGFDIYTKLVEDNGIDFGIQCLPGTYDSLIIPLGIDSKTGGEITFSAETLSLPATCSVIIEDKLTKTFTTLDTGASYKATMAGETSGTGRFYLHTSKLTTGTSSQLSGNEFKLKAYPANSKIIIEGEVGNMTQACLFDINGRKLGQYKLQEGTRNTITAPQLASGIYLLSVTEPGKTFNTKIVIY